MLPSTVTWVGPSSGGDWGTAANWSTNALPSSGDDVVIPANISLTHSQNSADTINSLTTGAGDALNISGGSLALNTDSTINGSLSVSGGTLGGTANLTVTGLFTWDGGTLTGAAGTSLTAQGGMTVMGYTSLLDTRNLINAGSAVVTGGFDVSGGANVENLSGATFDLRTSSGDFGNGVGNYPQPSRGGRFDNAGLLTSEAADANAVWLAFHNSGTVHVYSGRLTLLGGDAVTPMSSGLILGDSGTTLQFGSGPTTVDVFTPGSVLAADRVLFNGGSSDVQGSYSANATATINGAAVTFDGAAAPQVGNLAVHTIGRDGDIVTFNSGGTASPATVTLTGLALGDNSTPGGSGNATLGGMDNIVVSGLFNWDGGTLTGTAGTSLTAVGGLAIHAGVLDTRNLINAGTANWVGGSVGITNNASVTNSTNGTFNNQIDGTFGSNGSSCPVFTNQGLFLKSGGTGTTYLNMDLVNSGTVQVDQGVLNLGCGYIQGSGGSISGSVSGSVSNPGTYNSAPSSNPPVLTSYTQTITGTLYEQIGGLTAGTQYGQIIVNGNVNLAGTLQVALINSFTPQAGNTFTIIDNKGTNPINGTFANLPEGATFIAGGYQFQISYQGTYDPDGLANDVVLTVTKVATTTAVLSSVNPSLLSQAVTFTATVASVAAGAVTPTGTVQFTIDGNPVAGTFTLSGGQASFSTSALTVGSHTITATYNGDNWSLSSSGSLTQAVRYQFAWALAKQAYGLNTTVPIVFQLKDTAGNPVVPADPAHPAAVVSLQLQSVDSLGNPLGGAFTPQAKTSGQTTTGWLYNGPKAQSPNTYEFDWDASKDPNVTGPGYWKVLLVLNDGSITPPATIQLSKGKSGKLTADTGDAAGGASDGQLLAGVRWLYVDRSNGLVTDAEAARIDEALASVNAVIAPYGADIVEVDAADAAGADLVMDVSPTSSLGGMADGVLGCTTDAGLITIIDGWNFFAGSDASQIGAGQYDFETVAVHELGHALGLGHSTDSGSVMYATLNAGTVNRNLTTADLNVADSDTGGACGLHAAIMSAPVGGASNLPAISIPDRDDLLVGGNNRDILIGGTGADRLVGNAQDDILIAGWTLYDTDAAALAAVLGVWVDPNRAYSDRVSAIRDTGVGPNSAVKLGAATVSDDGAADVLTGKSGTDWFFANISGGGILDKITDLSAAEFATDLSFINSL